MIEFQKPKIDSSISMAKLAEVSKKSKDILLKAAQESKNPNVKMTSARREPEEQANAMFINLKNGNNIKYKSAGEEVVAVFNQYSNKCLPEDVKAKMTAKIIELSMKGQRVSLHCVDIDTYNKMNIVDVSLQMPNPRDFIAELLKFDDVKQVIAPFYLPTLKRYKYSKAEQAIHIEIKQ